MDNYTFLILDDQNNELTRAMNPIYLIHNLVKTYGLNNIVIKQHDETIKANIYNSGDLHGEPAQHQEEVQQLQAIKINENNYKLVFLKYDKIEVIGDDNN